MSDGYRDVRPGLDITAEQTRAAREALLGEPVELQKRDPFLRALQSLGHGFSFGIAPAPHRYADFPGGQLREEQLTPEQLERFKGMSKYERAQAMVANPTDLFHAPEAYLKSLLAPEPGMQSTTGKAVGDLLRLRKRLGEEKANELWKSQQRYTLSPEQGVYTGSGELVASAGPALEDLAVLNRELLGGDITIEQFERKQKRILGSARKVSDLEAIETGHRLGFISDAVYEDWRKGVGKPGISVTNVIKEKEERGAEVFNLARATAILRKARSIDARSKRGASSAASVANALGGLVGMFDKTAGQSISDWVIGGHIDRNELARFRKDLVAWAISNIAILTGELGARVSDPEQKIAKTESEVMGWTTDSVRMIAAIEQITMLRILKEESIRFAAGQPLDFPVDTDEQILAGAKKLIEAGFTTDTAVETMKRLLRMRELEYRVIE